MPAVIACVALVIALRRVPVLHPIVLWTGSWAMSTLLYALRLLPYRDLSWLTTALICGSILTFAAGVAGGTRLASRARPRARTSPAAAQVEIAAVLALALLALTLAAFVANLIAKFGVAHTLRISAEVKVYLSSNEAPASGVYVDFAIAGATLCALCATRATQRRARRVWLALAALAASSVYFSTSRGFIAVALASALVAFAIASRVRSHRRIAVGAIVAGFVVVVLFVSLGAVIGKTYGNSAIGQFDNFFSRHTLARPLALPYQDATASIPALDLLVRYSPTFGIAHGCATAPIACGALRKLGLHVLRVPVAGQFTALPLQWNAYTFLDRFLIDGGVIVTLLLVGLTGAVVGYLWQRALRGSLHGTVLYAISAPALVAAYRQNLIELVALAAIATLVLLLCASRLARVEAFSRWLPTSRAV